jgi:hypothetical protein
MWTSIGMLLKVKDLKDKYSDVLEVALFTGKDPPPSSVPLSKGSSLQQQTSSESPSGNSIGSSGQISSGGTNPSQEEGARGTLSSETF